jgi:hypothetical protein
VIAWNQGTVHVMERVETMIVICGTFNCFRASRLANLMTTRSLGNRSPKGIQTGSRNLINLGVPRSPPSHPPDTAWRRESETNFHCLSNSIQGGLSEPHLQATTDRDRPTDRPTTEPRSHLPRVRPRVRVCGVSTPSQTPPLFDL